MASKLDKLRAEILSDPLSIGYSTMSDKEVADSLMESNRSEIRKVVPASEVFAAIDPPDYLAISNQRHISYLSLMFSVDEVRLGLSGVRQILDMIFNGANTTLNRLQSLRTRSVSRATELRLGRIQEGHIAHARSA